MRVRASRGFTLTELLISLAVFAVLAVATSVYMAQAKRRAQDAAILSAARTIALDKVAPLVSDYPQRQHWGGRRNQRYLNGKLYSELYRPGSRNSYNYRNPVSANGLIRNGGIGNRGPAVLLTNRRNFRYDRIESRRNILRRSMGTIIVWMSNREPGVEVYYVDSSGRLSEFHWTT